MRSWWRELWVADEGAALELSPMRWRGGWFRLWDHAVGLCLAAVALFIFIKTPDMGFSRDEGFYFYAGKDYLGWFVELEKNVAAGDRESSFTQENIDRYWSYNPEHPVLLKALFGLSYRSFSQERQWLAPSTAMRLPTMVISALLLWLMYLFMAEAFTRMAGLFACAALISMPRVFYHVHVSCFDAAMMVMWFGVLWAYWKSLRSWPWVWLAGVAWGLALGTKLNAFFIPAVLLTHWALQGWAAFRIEGGPHGRRLVLPKVPLSLFTMATLGLWLFYMLWPRHWYESFARVAWYVERHLAHEHYATEYLGDLLAVPPFPMAFPFVMSWYTIPLLTMVACAVGWLALAAHTPWRARWDFLVRRVRYSLGGPWLSYLYAAAAAPIVAEGAPLRHGFRTARSTAAAWRAAGPVQRGYAWDSRGTVLLMGLGTLVPYLIIAMPNSPIFGGTKHWMTAMPFVACFAGIGVYWAVCGLCHVLGRRWSVFHVPMVRVGVMLAVMPLLLWPNIRATAYSRAYGTSYYNEIMGGYVGAADARMQRQFWGYTARAGLEWINQHAAPGALVHFHDTLYYSYEMYKEDGLLREDIGWAWSVDQAQYVLYHHERAFYHFLFEVWHHYQTTSPVHVVSIDGVPLLSIYENPHWRPRR